VQAQFQGSVHSSALFLTAAAQNLLCMKLASELGVAIASPWVTWFTAALAPALVGLAVTPLIMYKACAQSEPCHGTAAYPRSSVRAKACAGHGGALSWQPELGAVSMWPGDLGAGPRGRPARWRACQAARRVTGRDRCWPCVRARRAVRSLSRARRAAAAHQVAGQARAGRKRHTRQRRRAALR